jgi:hypothetical protein
MVNGYDTIVVMAAGDGPVRGILKKEGGRGGTMVLDGNY